MLLSVTAIISRLFFPVVLRLIFVHGPNNEEITLNVEEISSIRQVLHKDREDDYFHEEVHCVVIMTNGRFIGLREKCIDVIHLISEADKKTP